MKQESPSIRAGRQTAKERRRRKKAVAHADIVASRLALAFVGVLIASSAKNPFAPAGTVVAITPFLVRADRNAMATQTRR